MSGKYTLKYTSSLSPEGRRNIEVEGKTFEAAVRGFAATLHSRAVLVRDEKSWQISYPLADGTERWVRVVLED